MVVACQWFSPLFVDVIYRPTNFTGIMGGQKELNGAAFSYNSHKDCTSIPIPFPHKNTVPRTGEAELSGEFGGG